MTKNKDQKPYKISLKSWFGSIPKNGTNYSLKTQRIMQRTYAKMIEELAAKIEKKDGTRDVMNCLHSLVDISNDYLEAKQEGDLYLQKKIKKVLRETFEYLVINLG